MEVIQDNAAMLSNYEVFSLLQDIQHGKSQEKPGKHQEQLSTIVYETTKHLGNTTCVHQTPEVIQNFMEALKPYKLTKAEKLQLLNHRPVSAVEIQLIVEESEERLTEEQIEELLLVVEKYLPGGEQEEEVGEEYQQMEYH
ncbi:DNA-directed RNA polymerase III subunit RPC9-like [Liolophura sinensis]|uniref:DNA-directed RNA polymerase III subunit RPC9-like n=1 Tax=Liolophura sinensis TaxID=3198878 RepID=UPI00315921BA